MFWKIINISLLLVFILEAQAQECGDKCDTWSTRPSQEQNRLKYAVICISNHTDDQLKFQLQWGADESAGCQELHGYPPVSEGGSANEQNNKTHSHGLRRRLNFRQGICATCLSGHRFTD